MFADIANQKLYAFDSFPSSTSKGALKASSGLLELLPVSSSQVQFTTAYDITWQGAVVTFDGTTPICSLYDGTTPMGLWILAEYPPTLDGDRQELNLKHSSTRLNDANNCRQNLISLNYQHATPTTGQRVE